MNQTKQIVLAFLIPFSLAVGLALFANYFFPHGGCLPAEVRGEVVCFSYHDYPQTSFAEDAYTFLMIGLFLAALILPSFITRRTYQSKLGEINKKSIFN